MNRPGTQRPLAPHALHACFRPRPRLTARALCFWCALAGPACDDAGADEPHEPTAETPSGVETSTASAAAVLSGPTDSTCAPWLAELREQSKASGRSPLPDGTTWVPYAAVCGFGALEPIEARTTVLARRNVAAARSWLEGERAVDDAELRALVSLIERRPLSDAQPEAQPEAQAQAAADASDAASPAPPTPPPFDDPIDAIVSPVDDAVAAKFDRARTRLWSGGHSWRERLDARAYMARVESEALVGLGLDGAQPLPPLALRLAGTALADMLGFLESYWSRPVGALRNRAEQIELVMLDLVLALEQSPYPGGSAQRVEAQHRARLWLQREAARARLDARIEELGRSRAAFGADGRPRGGVESLAPPGVELGRLLDARLIDLAFDYAESLARDRAGYGLDPIEDEFLRVLAERGMDEGYTRAQALFDSLRVAGVPPLGPTPWDPAAAEPFESRRRAFEGATRQLADRALETLADASDPGTPPSPATRRALAELAVALELDPALRPRISLALGSDTSGPSPEIRALLTQLLALELPTPTGPDGIDHVAEAATRRHFALEATPD